MTTRPIRHDGPTPVYLQIADYIAADIASGALAPGDRIPTETDMHGEWGVARTTARRAVAELRERELVVTVPQRGTFVAGSEA
ncbi:regulatory GntR family protein [Krasilnikovia cinnamomea]|uniref:Regulatory GntR family protein n=1 Tax=Krasilnikovia cinnamomea TaxID=349313 RepID=A0A4Q7ZK30_9ACTN|nr:winged helix-turn-helix domain-containing protein [Krasilnikovia cinnamomea]RZU51272.1 regulatory GntR family protein [Krasilnikovia cinnamomea]